MRKRVVKKLRKVVVKQAVKSTQSKPKKTGLKKSDPDYYKKIGQISAAKRKLSPEFFAAMAKKSHNPKSRPNGYMGGRPKKDAKQDD